MFERGFPHVDQTHLQVRTAQVRPGIVGYQSCQMIVMPTIEKPSGTLAVVASLIAAVKLAKVESQELQNRSPRVRSAIADAVTLARMVVDAARK